MVHSFRFIDETLPVSFELYADPTPAFGWVSISQRDRSVNYGCRPGHPRSIRCLVRIGTDLRVFFAATATTSGSAGDRPAGQNRVECFPIVREGRFRFARF